MERIVSGPSLHRDLTRDDNTTLCDLKPNNDNVVKCADNISGVVVMDKHRYISELGDPNFYRPLETDTITEFRNPLKTLLSEIMSKGCNC